MEERRYEEFCVNTADIRLRLCFPQTEGCNETVGQEVRQILVWALKERLSASA